jgi:hypothetical protein
MNGFFQATIMSAALLCGYTLVTHEAGHKNLVERASQYNYTINDDPCPRCGHTLNPGFVVDFVKCEVCNEDGKVLAAVPCDFLGRDLRRNVHCEYGQLVYDDDGTPCNGFKCPGCGGSGSVERMVPCPAQGCKDAHVLAFVPCPYVDNATGRKCVDGHLK